MVTFRPTADVPDAPTREPAIASPARILVVDDEPDICHLLRKLLLRDGHTVSTAPNGRKALDILAKESVELLITDLRMPGDIDGLDLARRARDLHPALGVVVITGFASTTTAVDALRDGVDDYITKPFNIEQLRARIGRIVVNRRLLAEREALIQKLRSTNAEVERHRGLLSRRVEDVAEEIADLNQKLQRRVRDLDLISAVSRQVASAPEPATLLPSCLSLIAERLSARSAAIDVVVRGDLRRAARFGIEPPSDRLAREAIRTGTSRRAGEPTQELSVPITRQREVLGAVTLREPLRGEFREDDERLLEVLVSDLAVALENTRLAEQALHNTRRTLAALVDALESRYAYLDGHSRRVAETASKAGRELGLVEDDLVLLDRASRLHDIGKIYIPDRVHEKPGRLDPDELELMRAHPERGERILRQLPFLEDASRLIRHHHERWDGGGYPDGIEGEQIDVLTGLITIADSYDAMTHCRPYRLNLSDTDARAEVIRCAGSQFHPDLVEVFLEANPPR